MSFIGNVKKGHRYDPGYFLSHEECVRKTQEMSQSIATTTEEGGKYVPMGTIWPANDGTAVGIVYEDVDVTEGNMPGSVVMSGRIWENRLPVEINAEAKTALAGLGFIFEQEPTVTRPDFGGNEDTEDTEETEDTGDTEDTEDTE